MQRKRMMVAVVLAMLAVALLAAPALAATNHGGRPLYATLSGANEVPGPADPNGSGWAKFTLNQGQGTVCFTIHVEGIGLATTVAHIHPGAAGVANPPVVTLVGPNANGDSSGCVTADRDLIKAIRQHPQDYYVNVHNGEFPAGAVRGQLSK